MTDSGLNNNIDSILTRFDKDIEIWEPDIREIHKEDTNILIEKMISFGLIKVRQLPEQGRRSLVLETLGHEVKRSGSWTKYLTDKEDEKRANRQLIDSSVKANWLNKWLLIGTSLFSFLALCVIAADFIVHRKELQVAKEELRLHKAESKMLKYDSLTCSQANPKRLIGQ